MLLENAIKTAEAKGKVVGAIFLDLEKAYDTLWKEGLLKNLKQLGIKGKMYNYIQNFGKDRTFQVKVVSSLSSTKTQVNGTPQGAVISPTLFNIAINNIKKAITDRNTNISQFADDCALKDKKICYEQIQQNGQQPSKPSYQSHKRNKEVRTKSKLNKD